MQLRLADVVFEYTSEGKLRIEIGGPVQQNGRHGVLAGPLGQQALVDFLLKGIAQNAHKGVSNDTIDRIWKKIETAMSKGIKIGIPKANRAIEDMEEDFRKSALEYATAAIKAGDIATAVKCIEMYETL